MHFVLIAAALGLCASLTIDPPHDDAGGAGVRHFRQPQVAAQESPGPAVPDPPSFLDKAARALHIRDVLDQVVAAWRDCLAAEATVDGLRLHSRSPAESVLAVDINALWLDDLSTHVSYILLAHIMVNRGAFRLCSYFDEAGRSRLTVALAATLGWSLYTLATVTLYFAYHFFIIMASDGKLRPSYREQQYFAGLGVGILCRLYSTFLVFFFRSSSPGIAKQETYGLVDICAPSPEPRPVLRMLQVDHFQSPVAKHIVLFLHVSGWVVGTTCAVGMAACVHVALTRADLAEVAPSIRWSMAACALYIFSIVFTECARSVASSRKALKHWMPKVASTPGTPPPTATPVQQHTIERPRRALHRAHQHTVERVFRPLHRLLAADDDGKETPLESAGLAAASVSRLGPIMGILYLITWVRCLQLNPPYGFPLVPWMPQCLLFTAGALTIQTVSAFFAGFWGVEPADALGVVMTAENRVSCMLVHVSAGCVFFGLVPTIAKFYRELPAWSSGAGALHSALALSILYWSVQSLQWAAGTLLFFMGRGMPVKLIDDFRMAAFKVGACPGIIALTSTCWFRAYVLTDGHGSPQGWALDFMLSGSFFIVLETLPALLLALWRGGEPVDSRHPKLSYVISFVEAFSTTWLEFGVASVMFALLHLTPETATSTSRGGSIEHTLILICCILAVFLSMGKLIGMVVKIGIDDLNRSNVIGSNIFIGDMLVSLYDGYVALENVVIENPVTIQSKCFSDNIFFVEHIGLDVDTWQLIRSFGTHLNISHLGVRNLNFEFEMPVGRKSNLWHLLHDNDEPRQGTVQRAKAAADYCVSRTFPKCSAKMQQRAMEAEAARKEAEAAEAARKEEEAKNETTDDGAEGGLTFEMPSSLMLEDIRANTTIWGATIVLHIGDIVEDNLRMPANVDDTLRLIRMVSVFIGETVFRSFKAELALAARGSIRTAAQLANADWCGAERNFHGELQEVHHSMMGRLPRRRLTSAPHVQSGGRMGR